MSICQSFVSVFIHSCFQERMPAIEERRCVTRAPMDHFLAQLLLRARARFAMRICETVRNPFKSFSTCWLDTSVLASGARSQATSL